MNRNEQFQQIQSFIYKMMNKHIGISNVYLFESVDENGKVSDVKYGMNLLTNKGFNDIFKSDNNFTLSNSIKLYVGEGTSNFDKSTSYMETPLFGGLPATNSTTTKDFQYPIIYEPITGVITFVSRFGIVYYDYNIDNYDTDTMITEYGIGLSPNGLWTHSHIYDSTGGKSSITKKSNERLYIYIYTCLSMYEHVITNNWNNGIFITMTTNEIMFQRMFDTNVGTYKRGNILYNRNTGKHQTHNDVLTPDDIRNGIDSIIRNITTMDAFTLWSQSGTNNGYIDGFYYQAPGFMMINPEYMPQKESFTLNGFESQNFLSPSGFSDAIGKDVSSSAYDKNKYPTFTTMSDLNVYSFNYHSGNWDNPCPFINNDDISYTNAGMETNYCLPIYYFANGSIQTAYLFQNIDVLNDILSVNQGHVSLYACEKYWDNSTWISIVNFNNIPQEARNCRYWIASVNTRDIIPTRRIEPFQLLDYTNGTNGYKFYEQQTFNAVHEGIKPYVDNPTHNCAILGGKICALTRLRGYDFASDSYDMCHMTHGKWLISFQTTNNTINTIDLSGLNDAEPDTSVLSVTRTLEFTSNTNPYSETYKSESGNGLICIQSLNANESIILSIGSVITSSLKQWMRSCCIYNTNLIAYIPVNDTTHIHIYDTYLNSDVGNNITLPTGYTPDVIFGVGSHIWFCNGTTTYHVDISTTSRILVECNNITLGTFANSYKLAITSTNDVIMIYNTQSTNKTLSDIYYTKTDYPNQIQNMNAFYNTDSQYITTSHIICQLRYINSNTLICVINLCDSNVIPHTSRTVVRYICDLGRYIKLNETYSRYEKSTNFNGCYMYGLYVFYNTFYLFPILNMMPLKIEGRTKTITTFNHTKSISGKTFEIGFTNIPLWGYEVNGSGKPPGSPTPIFNGGNGQIIGWT